jgi:hypothetical protein
VIDETNNILDFDEGSGEVFATLDVGEYTLGDLAVEIDRALNDAGVETYTVTVDRTTRLIEIVSAGSSLDLLVATGSHLGTSAYTLIGFTGSDRTGALTYEGNVAVGSVYEPQFKLQSYVSSDDWQQAADASINKTASGRIEVVKFGIEKFYQWNINFATNIEQPCGGPILNNPSGLASLRDFMQYCITRNPLEFMPDKNDPDTYFKILLESTPDNQNGTGYRLKELYDKNAPGYFETGITKWRLIED